MLPKNNLEHIKERIPHQELCPQLPMAECRKCAEEHGDCPAIETKCYPTCPSCAVDEYKKRVEEHIERQREMVKLLIDESKAHFISSWKLTDQIINLFKESK